MRPLLMLALLFAAPGLMAQKAAKLKPPVVASYAPDLKLWRLEVAPDLGGWSSDRTVNLRLKLVDPKDPNPPKDEPGRRYYDDYEDEGGYDPGGEDTRTAEQLRQARLEREAETARQAWRARTLKVWFNGATLSWSVRVGHTLNTDLTAQNGENRLEILEPDSGLRVVRSWWVSTARTRLRVVSIHANDEYTGGSLQVLEPDGAVAEGGRRTASGGMLRWSGEYTHDTPPPGTYTLKWMGGWRGGKPARIKVEAVLDGGTDQERRWTWERLILPGAGPVTMGTFDVEP
ncbi:MAG: hypothetical protein HXX12_00060 [Geothrix sp.]|uniref:hypothetical protein n=1 Tax=Geothrix sp. TaxID=1962974 RepID=UPI001795A0B2|nr:hypothetical protein [Geothrix sp.]NWJ39348.1 hypothetical protein [Geothrix sp.]WIL19427.1 MAG: hypothetical protein QOZ81_001942 [Geothrix sp.]